MKKLLCGLLLSFTVFSADAALIDVGGVQWDPDAGSDFSSVSSIFENSITTTNTNVIGYGKVTEFNGMQQSEFCPACELTFVFDFIVNPVTASTFTMSNLVVNFYVDTAKNFTANRPRLAQAQDGTHWLTLTDATGTMQGTGGNLQTPNAYGNGNGYLNVLGGLAAQFFDTNAMLNGYDLELSSSFHKNVNAKETGYDLSGSVFINGDTHVVPLPATIWLFAPGLLALLSIRKKTV